MAARARCAALQGTAVLAGNGDLRLARQVRLTRAKESREKKKEKEGVLRKRKGMQTNTHAHMHMQTH